MPLSQNNKTAILVAFISGLIANVDRIYLVGKDVVGKVIDSSSADKSILSNFENSTWTGYTREYSPIKNVEEISREMIAFHDSSNNSEISGEITVSRPDAPARKWNFDGIYKQHLFIIRSSVLEPKDRKGTLASIVLEGSPDEGHLNGYWVGYDPDKKKLMACPYALYKMTSAQASKDVESWLNVSCSETL